MSDIDSRRPYTAPAKPTSISAASLSDNSIGGTDWDGAAGYVSI